MFSPMPLLMIAIYGDQYCINTIYFSFLLITVGMGQSKRVQFSQYGCEGIMLGLSTNNLWNSVVVLYHKKPYEHLLQIASGYKK